ncbi:MAG: carbamoyl-phosphate synthase large subunit [Evtepia sp.]|uniref:carbamoyl-phosphate synthase large subunit n=1 Tax=Evtepia sp. TaxID=2773933 RepID=UPI002A76491E|nr:carbamoyl-phosphate synthase large subunit [Evtepia sp.]MDY3015166.1 carbamoyl-phosphate synthase large subunit [Evtepia sp.]
MPKDTSIKKVLVIGSGPIVIGQAAEFDYAGTQACRILQQEGIETVLVNSNPATIMTDNAMADAVYLEPLTTQTVKRIIEETKPDSLLAGLGGQTGLTIAMELAHEGFLKSHNVRLIGTNADAIDKAEDRQLFKDAMARIGEPTIPSDTANDIETAVAIANRIGYPVIVRPAFTLGGGGGGVAYSEEELREVGAVGLDYSPITQVLIEKYIFGWKEIEFEVMRDHKGTAITICSMENFDPVGIHTGDSIVVAPALTLGDKEYQMLRSAALKIIEELGIEGGCNCQFALNPDSFEYAVIEVNPRVSRSSALASKASGYPIAKVTAKIALGYTLDEIRNDVTGETFACFEPALDYVVVKFPKWPFDKFHGASRKLGSQMKATGEVMSIGHTFEAALMKAVRGAEIKLDSLHYTDHSGKSLDERLASMDDLRLFTIFEALTKGVSVDHIHDITKIDKWFICKLMNLVRFEETLKNGITPETYLQSKKLGYPDQTLARLSGTPVASLPHRFPSYKMVDTCAAEFQARTPYFYATYDDLCDARTFPRKGRDTVIVLGSGPIRIGQGIEFDYSSVHCVQTLKKLGYDVVIINNNPETVSTDYDTADRLYFEPLSPEDVMSVIEVEKPVGVVVAFGGQTAISLTEFLDSHGIPILGTSADGIDTAEDRGRFDALLENLNIRRPKGMSITTLEEALEASESLGYPVLLRPSYVIGGQNMVIAHDRKDVEKYMNVILSGGIKNDVLVDKYMPGTELEVDVISDGTDVLMPGIMEHIERAGVHSGDSIAVYPPYSLTDKMTDVVVECSKKLALALGTKGLVNIQYLIYRGELFVIEVNPRASRTVPYLSKVTGVPMVDLATRIMMGATLKELGYPSGLWKTPPYYAVKVPVFSFEKISDANSLLGPEMKSTGEVLGLGRTFSEAMFKGFAAAGYRHYAGKGVLLSVENHELPEVVGLAKKLDDLKMPLYATRDTAQAIRSLGIHVNEIEHIVPGSQAYQLMEDGKIGLIIYTGALYDDTIQEYIELHRDAIRHSIACITSLDTANAMANMMASRFHMDNTELVNLNNMRKERQLLPFAKMQGCGNDYIFFDNRDGKIASPGSLCISLCDRHYGIGGYGIVLIEDSDVADAKMRIFNRDGTEGKMAGNSIRCVGKYLYDKDIVKKEYMTIETAGGIKSLLLYIRNGKANTISVGMGKADLLTESLPSTLPGNSIINRPVEIADGTYNITCASIGNPHCVVFCDDPSSLDLETIGPKFEYAPYFPERINTEFVRIVNEETLRMRVYERGNGETVACGTGACAAVIAATENGYVEKGRDITVKLVGGDLTVNYTDNEVILTGDAVMVYEGFVEY